MPVYKFRIRMRDSELLGDQDYSFNGHLSWVGTSLDAWGKALEVAESLAGTVLPPNVNIYEVDIRNPDLVNGIMNVPQSIDGTRTVTGDALPAWNVAKLSGRAGSGTRLYTWHIRMGLREPDVNGQLLTIATQDTLTALINAFNLAACISDKDGALITEWGFTDRVTMRQMSWHRRTRPGFKRGWVPV
jgi:hypothetical protein